MSIERHFQRFTTEQEKEIAREMHAAETRAREALRGIEAADQVLDRRSRRKEQTRAATVDRLEEAVQVAWRASREDRSLRRSAAAAKQAWDQVEGLRWRLAMSARRIAHGEARKLAGPLLDEADLVQEGYIGLLRAAKRFEPDRGIKFETYARWWVRAQMTRAIDSGGRPVRLPGCAVEQARNLRKARKQFEAAGVKYSVADLAEEVGIDKERAELLLSQGSALSLDQPSGDEPDGRTLLDVLSDEQVADADEEAIRAQQIDRMLQAFEQVLTERQRFILRQRYGLDDGEFRTLASVGKEMGLSRERVRQIERDALKRLREQAGLAA